VTLIFTVESYGSREELWFIVDSLLWCFTLVFHERNKRKRMEKSSDGKMKKAETSFVRSLASFVGVEGKSWLIRDHNFIQLTRICWEFTDKIVFMNQMHLQQNLVYQRGQKLRELLEFLRLISRKFVSRSTELFAAQKFSGFFHGLEPKIN
jgi:hypothetical protein